jgi:hypothetical protein
MSLRTSNSRWTRFKPLVLDPADTAHQEPLAVQREGELLALRIFEESLEPPEEGRAVGSGDEVDQRLAAKDMRLLLDHCGEGLIGLEDDPVLIDAQISDRSVVEETREAVPRNFKLLWVLRSSSFWSSSSIW